MSAAGKVDLLVRIGELTLRNPVMPAWGAFAEGLEKVKDFNRLGAFVTKTITRELRAGNPLPRMVERPGRLINAIGIPSKGAPYFIATTMPHYAVYDPPLVASILAPTAEGFASLAGELSIPGIAAIEANVSCPNIAEDGKAFAMRAESTEKVTRELRKATKLPLWVKLTPNTGEVPEVARAAETAGADAVVVANTILSLAIDLESFKAGLGNRPLKLPRQRGQARDRARPDACRCGSWPRARRTSHRRSRASACGKTGCHRSLLCRTADNRLFGHHSRPRTDTEHRSPVRCADSGCLFR